MLFCFKRFALGALIAFCAIGSSGRVEAQVAIETIGLQINPPANPSGDHFAIATANANGGPQDPGFDFGITAAEVSLAGSSDDDGAFGQYTLLTTSELVAGTPGGTVTGLNLTGSIGSSLTAYNGGAATFSCNANNGNNSATVQTPSVIVYPADQMIAEGMFLMGGTDDQFSGTSGTVTILRNGEPMAFVQGNGENSFGFTTRIVGGQEVQDMFYGEYTFNDCSFFTVPGDVLTVDHTTSAFGQVQAGPGEQVVSTATLSVMGDIQVTLYGQPGLPRNPTP